MPQPVPTPYLQGCSMLPLWVIVIVLNWPKAKCTQLPSLPSPAVLLRSKHTHSSSHAISMRNSLVKIYICTQQHEGICFWMDLLSVKRTEGCSDTVEQSRVKANKGRNQRRCETDKCSNSWDKEENSTTDSHSIYPYYYIGYISPACHSLY